MNHLTIELLTQNRLCKAHLYPLKASELLTCTVLKFLELKTLHYFTLDKKGLC